MVVFFSVLKLGQSRPVVRPFTPQCSQLLKASGESDLHHCSFQLVSFLGPWNFPPFKWVHPSLFIFLFYYHFIQHYFILNGNFKSLVLSVQKKYVILFIGTKGSHDRRRRLSSSTIRDYLHQPPIAWLCCR